MPVDLDKVATGIPILECPGVSDLVPRSISGFDQSECRRVIDL